MEQIRCLLKEEINECIAIISDSQFLASYYPNTKTLYSSIYDGICKNEIFGCRDDKGIFIGFVWFKSIGIFNSFPYLHMIAVDKAYHQKGYGKLLLNYYEQKVLKDNNKLCTSSYLLVNVDNIRAKRFYDKCGYKEISLLENLFKKNKNEILMKKNIIKSYKEK